MIFCSMSLRFTCCCLKAVVYPSMQAYCQLDGILVGLSLLSESTIEAALSDQASNFFRSTTDMPVAGCKKKLENSL